MRIQHNIMAMNSYRNFNKNTNALSKNLERLSSGYRINRAGDDAAGLAISEKMRAQITGLDAAQKNVQDGISMVKTAEGAMQEVQDMMNRMKYLATQSSNGTYQDEVDRENLQKEVDALRTEINRIADSANFNGIKLLDGTMDSGGVAVDIAVNGTFKEGVNQDTNPSFEVNLNGLAIAASATSGNVTIKVGDASIAMKFSGVTKGKIIDWTKLKLASTATKVTLGELVYKMSCAAGSGKITFTYATASSAGNSLTKDGAVLNPNFSVSVDSVTNGKVKQELVNKATVNVKAGIPESPDKPVNAEMTVKLDMLKDGYTVKIADKSFKIDYSKKLSESDSSTIGVKDLLNEKGQLEDADIKDILDKMTEKFSSTKWSLGTDGNKLTIQSNNGQITDAKEQDLYSTEDGVKSLFVVESGEAMALQIGDTADSFNQMKVSIGDMHTDALGIGDIDISTRKGAQEAIQKIQDAINSVSSTRGDLGAIQNRLEHTANNLSIMEENIQNAESAIRDTDMADEMTTYTKNNILIQSAQAMLAQANQQPQGVLQLLQ